MATLNNFERIKNFATRPNDNCVYPGHVWLVEKGERYDLVQFTIKEVKGYYWDESICVPTDFADEQVENIVNERVSLITDAQISEYLGFIEDLKQYGCD